MKHPLLALILLTITPLVVALQEKPHTIINPYNYIGPRIGAQLSDKSTPAEILGIPAHYSSDDVVRGYENRLKEIKQLEVNPDMHKELKAVKNILETAKTKALAKLSTTWHAGKVKPTPSKLNLIGTK